MKMISVLEKIDFSEISVDDKPVVSEELSFAKLTVNVSETENQGKGEIIKVLGLHWDCTNDEFIFDFEKLAEYTN